MDYSKLSDFEINNLVAKLSSVDCCVRINFSGEAMGGSAEKWLCRNEEGTRFDPSNNPADAWPIIAANKINIEFEGDVIDGKEEWWSIASWGRTATEHQFHTDDNPLRAAMIVFLMMQDSANVPANSTGSDIR